MFVVAVIAWGVGFYGLGFYLRELRRTHGWSLQTITLATMWFYVASIGTSLVVRRLLRRGRQRAVFVLGGVALAASLVAMSQVDARWQLAGTYLGLALALAWSCLSIYPISATILTWYPEGSGPPLSLALTGASVGGLVLVPLLTDLSDRFGFGPSVAGVGIGAGLVLVLLSTFVIRVPAAAGTAPATVPTTAATARADVLGDVRFWTLALGFGLSFTVQVGFLLHQLSVLSDHLTDGVAARIVAGTSLGALVGRLVFGALTPAG